MYCYVFQTVSTGYWLKCRFCADRLGVNLLSLFPRASLFFFFPLVITFEEFIPFPPKTVKESWKLDGNIEWKRKKGKKKQRNLNSWTFTHIFLHNSRISGSQSFWRLSVPHLMTEQYGILGVGAPVPWLKETSRAWLHQRFCKAPGDHAFVLGCSPILAIHQGNKGNKLKPS